MSKYDEKQKKHTMNYLKTKENYKFYAEPEEMDIYRKVICNSSYKSMRYFLREALLEKIEREELASKADIELLRSLIK